MAADVHSVALHGAELILCQIQLIGQLFFCHAHILLEQVAGDLPADFFRQYRLQHLLDKHGLLAVIPAGDGILREQLLRRGVVILPTAVSVHLPLYIGQQPCDVRTGQNIMDLIDVQKLMGCKGLTGNEEGALRAELLKERHGKGVVVGVTVIKGQEQRVFR